MATCTLACENKGKTEYSHRTLLTHLQRRAAQFDPDPLACPTPAGLPVSGRQLRPENTATRLRAVPHTLYTLHLLDNMQIRLPQKEPFRAPIVNRRIPVTFRWKPIPNWHLQLQNGTERQRPEKLWVRPQNRPIRERSRKYAPGNTRKTRREHWSRHTK